jgi:hypothetical protein
MVQQSCPVPSATSGHSIVMETCSPYRDDIPVWQNCLNYSGSSALIIIYKDKMISNALQTEQPMGLSGHRPMQPRLHRIGVGYTHTRRTPGT